MGEGLRVEKEEGFGWGKGVGLRVGNGVGFWVGKCGKG